MKALVTGATGFIGRHVVAALLDRGHTVSTVARNRARAQALPWFDKVEFISCDIHQSDLDVRHVFGAPADAAIHLAWPGLPNYESLSHFEETLPADYRFLKNLILAGYRQLLVTGTCFEYGMQSGELTEDTETRPSNPYGLAKDCLRKFLQALNQQHPFSLQWTRLFYSYGAGQNPSSLFGQLETALKRGDKEFPMSGGEQLRDYMRVEDIAASLVRLVEHPECTGIVNVCSGRPISIRRLVEDLVRASGMNIQLKLGHYPYPDYEPMAFWGRGTRYNSIVGKI